MDFSVATFGLAFAAGGLSTLSPCVLPLIPILLGTAIAAHRLGPFALAGGLALSFTLVGVLIASVGVALGLDQAVLRNFAAVLLLAFGILLLSSRLQERFAAAASGVSGAGQNLLSRVTLEGLPGQFILGLLLGLVWSPCVGPTLGAAITLASQGRDLLQVTLLMAVFGVGAALPLVILGVISRQALLRVRGRLLAAGKAGKQWLGAIMLLLGLLILSGLDKRFEAWVLSVAPDWLVRLTTSI
ncbi:MAG: cytochrome c biogenesis protein CcdA [Betaproteobacteria bacterium]|jgi:cytochrome c biogenesis protein CcdA|nr:cytochrome c biogenesis protein CcdA [Betaproteobacteria bacterium]HMV21444.1 cytochrome c biogenesis CcdA family protein [Rhodocyclaceae bacterium]HMW76767.1 cytochrome c biogenesis CcdA family protein [Rhodocyclaceae bacterium]HNE42989.1 cytochrome c biogenesis CcdA family protein [Rhodocyclaceae bacterium]HNM23553.1 cytochrome c biogenesis CcdA family protein [Rhodocyclaceae bacterium]